MPFLYVDTLRSNHVAMVGTMTSSLVDTRMRIPFLLTAFPLLDLTSSMEPSESIIPDR
jgi:hypothetical protein